MCSKVFTQVNDSIPIIYDYVFAAQYQVSLHDGVITSVFRIVSTILVALLQVAQVLWMSKSLSKQNEETESKNQSFAFYLHAALANSM